MIDDFFAYARERHAVYLRRASGSPAPWTEDPVLQQYRFCNIFRELDATTIWFRENVRDPLRDRPEVLLATVVFRLFNRITTGEAIFCQPDLYARSVNETPFEVLLHNPDEGFEAMKRSILAWCGSGPYTTGSYMTKTPTGMGKLDGMLQVIEWFVTQSHLWPWPKGENNEFYEESNWWQYASWLHDFPGMFTLKDVWAWLVRFPFIGDFTAYEIVTDLRHTALLDRAPDINTWANPGPGAKRGLKVIFGDDAARGQTAQNYMSALLACSREKEYWPNDWPVWEMREVEHTLCEYYKIHRARTTGQGTRQKFRGGVR